MFKHLMNRSGQLVATGLALGLLLSAVLVEVL